MNKNSFDKKAAYQRAIDAVAQQKEENKLLIEKLEKAKALPESYTHPPKKEMKKKPKVKKARAPKKASKRIDNVTGFKVFKNGKMVKMTPAEELEMKKTIARKIKTGDDRENVKKFMDGKRKLVVDKIAFNHLIKIEHGEKIAHLDGYSVNWNEKEREWEARGGHIPTNEFSIGGWMPGYSGTEYKKGNIDSPPRMSEEFAFNHAIKKKKAKALRLQDEMGEQIPSITEEELQELNNDEITVLKAAAKVEAIVRHSREDKEFFIQKFVRIEDKDAPDPMVLFRLWPKQKEALEAFDKYKLTIVLKARQLGLSWLALAYAVHGLVFQPGYSVVALSKREDEAKELVRRVKLILEYLPPFIIRKKDKNLPPNYTGPVWDATTTYVSVMHPGSKVPAMFTSFTSSPDSARSFTASLVILDEWAFQMYAQEIWAAAYPVINRPTGGKVIGISTAKIGSFFEEVWRLAMKGKNNFHPVFLPWYSDPRRTQSWYEESKAALPSSYLQEYPATPDEAFSSGSATAFPEFDVTIHTCEPFPIPEHWRRWISVDNGYDHPFAWYWYAVDEDGNVYIYREFSRSRDDPKLLYSDQGAMVQDKCSIASLDEAGDLHIGKEYIDFCVAGLDAWNTHHRDATGKNLLDYYRDGGLMLGYRRAITDRRLRKAVVHEYLKVVEDGEGNKRAKIQIFNTCKHLIDTLPKLPKDNHDNEKVAACSIDDQYDSLSYGLVAYHVERSIGLTADVPLIRAHKDSIAKRGNRQVKARAYY